MAGASETDRQAMMDDVCRGLDGLRRSYTGGINDIEQVGQLALKALTLLSYHSKARELDHWADSPGGERFYDAFESGGKLSRPIRRDLFIKDPMSFEASWSAFCRKANDGTAVLQDEDLSRCLYTCVQGLAAAYDLFRPSPKPPGTFFEIMVGSFASKISGLSRKAYIKLPREGYKVTADITVELRQGGPGIVLPCKITTRERMVQVFAHQRLLDSVFGEGTYRSALVCVSETQRDGALGVKEICVPTQVEIFQKYLAKLEGLYYLDPPTAYVRARFAQEGFRPRLPVKDLAVLFTKDLAELKNQLNEG